MGGFQDTLFGQNLSFRVEKGAFVQVIHGNGHWLCITRSGHDKGEIEVIDSMFSTLPVKVVKQVGTMVHSQLPTLNLKFLDIQHQRGSSDCGLYTPLPQLQLFVKVKTHAHSFSTRIVCVPTSLNALKRVK